MPLRRYTATPFSLLNVLLDIAETLLVLRFVFRLFAANAANAIVRLLYNLTDPLIAPFRNIFANWTRDGMVIEWSVVIAMVAYALLALLIVRFFDMLVAPSDEDIVEHHHHHHHA